MKAFRSAMCGIVFNLAVTLLCGPSQATAQVTPPEQYLGFAPGADFHLMTYEQAMGYFEHIAAQTDRMLVLDMGETSEGRAMKYGVISSAENLARLDHYKDISRRLSLVRDVTDEEARRLAEEGKTIVWIDGGLHGTEVAPAQLLPQLAYDLVTGSERQATMIRENVIALLVFANPDGMTIVSDWYMGNVGTPYEVSRIPWLYHKYVGHDNNRDSFMANLIETQNMNQAHSREWYPQILYNQHQTGPFPARIWIPPDAEPTNPNVHPLIVRWKSLIGTAMGKAFEENDQPGAISRIRYDTWYPGYATQVVDGHNVASILTETQLYRYATPQHFTVNDFPEAHRDLIKGVFYPNPWPGGWWRIGDAVAYNSTACKAVLEVAARYRYEMLYDKYKAGADVIERFTGEPPYGWIVPADQPDRSSAALLVQRMMINGIDVYTADESFEHNGINYAAGTFILPTSQPFGLFLKNILPAGVFASVAGIGQSRGLGGQSVASVRRRRLDAADSDGSGTLADDVTVDSPGDGSRPHRAGRACLRWWQFVRVRSRRQQQHDGSDAAARGGRSSQVDEPAVHAGRSEICRRNLRQLRAGNPSGPSTMLRMPRIGLHRAWVASMDAGWMSYVFDTYGIPFQALTNASIRAGDLAARFDVIVLADQGASQIIDGHRKGTIPPDYVGGIGDEGVIELREFVQNGGTLITNNSSSDLPIEHFDLPVKNILDGVPADSFNCPGALLKAEFKTDHPLAYGMPERGMVFFSRGRVFEIGEDDDEEEDDVEEEDSEDDEILVEIVATYPDEWLLLSGWMIGDEMIREKAAALDVSYGEGKIFLFGFNVHNRAQARSTMKMLFNALLYR